MKPDVYEFKYTSEENGNTISHAVFLPDDCTWYEVMEHFCSFLEGVGYQGVVKKAEDSGIFSPFNENEYTSPFKGSDVE